MVRVILGYIFNAMNNAYVTIFENKVFEEKEKNYTERKKVDEKRQNCIFISTEYQLKNY